MAREYFKCFHSYFEKTKSLTDAEVGRLFRALLKFSATGDAPSLAGRESIAFDFIADEILRDQNAYAQLCRQNAQNRAQRPSTTVNDRQRNATEGNETDKVEGKRNLKEKPHKGGKKKSVFVPPTVEEVRAYCEQRHNNVDPEYFVAYYGSQHWVKANGQPVDNWKLTVITWEKDQPKPIKQKNAALRYPQSPISKKDFDAMTVDLGGEA